MKQKRRGIALAWVPSYVQRVLVLRTGEIMERTDRVNAYGSKLWAYVNGRTSTLNGQTRVKPVFKYSDIFGDKE